VKAFFKTRKFWIIFGGTLIVLVGPHLFSDVWLKIKTSSSIRKDFLTESKNLQDPFSLLGLSTTAETADSCYLSDAKHFSSYYFCTTNSYAPYPTRTMNTEEIATYKKNAPVLVKLLLANGWTHDNDTEYANSSDKLLNVAYHKNIGAVSCNLRMSSSTFGGYSTTTPDTDTIVFINQFSCQSSVSVPDLNLVQKHHVIGP